MARLSCSGVRTRPNALLCLLQSGFDGNGRDGCVPTAATRCRIGTSVLVDCQRFSAVVAVGLPLDLRCLVDGGVAAVREYHWTQIAGSALSLETIPTADPTLRLPPVVVPGVYQFRLSVQSECAVRASDNISVTYVANLAAAAVGSAAFTLGPQHRSGTESPVQTFGQSAITSASPLNTASDEEMQSKANGDIMLPRATKQNRASSISARGLLLVACDLTLAALFLHHI